MVAVTSYENALYPVPGEIALKSYPLFTTQQSYIGPCMNYVIGQNEICRGINPGCSPIFFRFLFINIRARRQRELRFNYFQSGTPNFGHTALFGGGGGVGIPGVFLMVVIFASIPFSTSLGI